MQIQVSLIVEISATATVAEMEQQIQTAGQQSMRQAMQQSIRAWEEQHRRCPQCDKNQVRLEGTVRRHLQTLFGPVGLAMRRFRCQDCWHRYCPARNLLAPLQQGTVTQPLQEAAVLAGASWPYRQAAQVLHRLCGASISGEQVRLLTNRTGTTHAKLQQEAARQAVSAPQVVCTMTQSAQDRGVIGLDGGWVASREQRGGMEGKVGVIAMQKELLPSRPVPKLSEVTWYEIAKRARKGWRLTPAPARARFKQRKYVATFAPSRQIGEQAACAADQLGIDRQMAVVVADGADWIKQEAQRHFPQATKILDWPHLWRIVSKALRSMSTATNQSDRWRDQQSEQLRSWLWNGHVEPAHERLTSWLAEAGPTAGKAIRQALTYLTNQRAWIGSYEHWKQQGYPVGSGIIERAVAIVINRRMKKRGMRWKRTNATAVVALRVDLLNEDWSLSPSARSFP
jgi:hypothetical protein